MTKRMETVRWLLSFIGLHEFFTFKILYLFLYSGYGILMPYAPVYYALVHLTKAQIGILSMMPNFCSFFVAPLFSALGDRFHAHFEIMVLCLLFSTIFTSATLVCTTFAGFCLVMLISSILRAPISPSVDALVIASLSDKTRYGEMRLWGAVSYGIFSLVGGVTTSIQTEDSSGKSIEEREIQSFRFLFGFHTLFFLCAGFILLYIMHRKVWKELEAKLLARNGVKDGEKSNGTVSLSHSHSISSSSSSSTEPSSSPSSLPSPSASSFTEVDEEGAKEATETVNPPSVLSALYSVSVSHPEVFLFSLVVFLSGFGSGVIDAFLFVYLKQIGASGWCMGISRFITCAAEVPMFLLAGPLQQKYGTWPLLCLTQGAFVVRLLYYSQLRSPWAVLPCEVLHGLTFAVTWSVSCTYANALSPPHCHGTMQSLLEGLHWGLGSGAGAVVGGYLYQSLGAVRLFEISAGLSFVSMLCAAFRWYYERQQPTNSHRVDRGQKGGTEQQRQEHGQSRDVVVYSSLQTLTEEDDEREKEEDEEIGVELRNR